MEITQNFLGNPELQIEVFKNEVGGAEIFCQNPCQVPGEVNQRLKELKLDILNQYPEILKSLKDGKKELFFISHDYNGFTIVISSIYE
jgi:hypothetical protein